MKKEREDLAVVDRTMTATKPAVAATFWRLDALSKSLLLDHLKPQQAIRFLQWADENAERIRRVREAEIEAELRATATEDDACLGRIGLAGVPGAEGHGTVARERGGGQARNAMAATAAQGRRAAMQSARNGQGGDFMDLQDNGVVADNDVEAGDEDDDVAMGDDEGAAVAEESNWRKKDIADAGSALARQLLRVTVEGMTMEAPQKLLKSMQLNGRI